MQLSPNANPKGLSHHNLSVTERVGSQSHEHWDSMSILLHHWAYLSPCLYSVVENLTWTIQAGLFLLVQSHIFCLNSPIPGPLLPDRPWTGCGEEGGWRPGWYPVPWRTLSPSSAVASCLGDAAWVLWSSSFPSCLLMMLTTPACPGTGRSKLSEPSLSQAQVISTLSAFTHSSGASLETQDFPAVHPEPREVPRCCELPPVHFSRHLFYLDSPPLRTWEESVSLPFSPCIKFIWDIIHHVPSTHHQLWDGMEGLFHNGAQISGIVSMLTAPFLWKPL